MIDLPEPLHILVAIAKIVHIVAKKSTILTAFDFLFFVSALSSLLPRKGSNRLKVFASIKLTVIVLIY